MEYMDDIPSKSLPARTGMTENSPVSVATAPMPALIESAGGAAKFAWEEFVYGRLRNAGTRRAYLFAVQRFLGWCDERRVDLVRIAPAHVGRYLDEQEYAPATKKLHLSAIRHFFDELVLRHVVFLNPAAAVRGERLQVVEGKTPEISGKQCRKLLSSIDTSNVVGLRDRAIITVMIYTAARVGAVSRLRRGDFYDLGDQFCFRLTEKGTKHRELPVRHDLRGFILEYLAAGGLEYSDKSSPLFRTTTRPTNPLSRSSRIATAMSLTTEKPPARPGDAW